MPHAAGRAITQRQRRCGYHGKSNPTHPIAVRCVTKGRMRPIEILLPQVSLSPAPCICQVAALAM